VIKPLDHWEALEVSSPIRSGSSERPRIVRRREDNKRRMS
jgi:hypothetical protein